MTDKLVKAGAAVFLPVWEQTGGNDGYVSFELDPLLEDPKPHPPMPSASQQYIELGQEMVGRAQQPDDQGPRHAAGLACALEELAAAGMTLNVTLIFPTANTAVARDAIWRRAQSGEGLDGFKSVYSIFVSRVDVYTEKHVPKLSPAAQGMVGIVNAKRIVGREPGVLEGARD